MIFHENCLLADNSHEISYLIFFQIREDVAKSAAVMIGALRVKILWVLSSYYPEPHTIKSQWSIVYSDR